MKECDRFTWDVTNEVTWACSSFQVCVQAQLRGLGFYLFVFIATAAIAVLFALCGEESAAGGSELWLVPGLVMALVSPRDLRFHKLSPC